MGSGVEAAQHQSCHGDMNHCFTVDDKLFVIAPQAARLHQPPKGALDNPPLVHHAETALVRRAIDDFQPDPLPVAHIPQPIRQLATIATIGPDQAQSTAIVPKHLQHQPRPITVLHGGRRHHHRQNQPQRVHHHMAFATSDLFPGIVTPHSGLIRDLHRLTVDDPGGGIRVLTGRMADELDEHVMYDRPDVQLAPPPKIAIDGLPRREVMRQEPPRTTRRDDIKDGIDNHPARMPTRPAKVWRFRNQVLNAVPLLVSETAGIQS